ncbi:NEL-type E3 ubiquitin ligase domain-containing protein [Pseudomonas sp. K1(2024)]|uniref:RING-type E3 ubiquitin transferase n=1 Tax=Pseudomonas boreofloridensis TaxID=3064348 RepID=A0ABV4Z729_9PSED|nr:NEL-type E3 ubiquitin ligase domain-containing protein [Pseudomonas sp. K13]MDO7902034.1 NEL-type E3 ubiquitin ligase domain-containing protein [Pseudomonas sp. K13]
MTPVLHPESVDTFIASRLPPWLTRAGLDQFTLYRRALSNHRASAERLAALLDSIPTLDDFAEQRLGQALKARGVPQTDLRRSCVRITRQAKAPSVGTALPGPVYPVVSQQSLLGAALHNFHVAETRPHFMRTGQLLDPQGKPLPLGLEAFAGLCRQVDIGKAYQARLEQCLRPADVPGQPPGEGRRVVNRVFEESWRASLELAVRTARLKDELDETRYLQLLPLFARPPVVPTLPVMLTTCQPYLLGKCLRGVVGIEVRDVGKTELSAVLIWIANDPERPMSCHRSWDAFYRAQAERLRQVGYQRFFQHLVSLRDRPQFLSVLRARLAKLDASQADHLDGRALPLAEPLFSHLRQQQIDTLFDDARLLAVPTGDEDEEDRQQRLQRYLSLGMDLVGMAGFFVPLLGQALLVVGVAQIANDIYEGYEDWQIGDRKGAIDHALSIAEQVVIGAVVSVGGAAVAQRLPRLDFVDALAPVRLDDGQVRLMDPQLAGYYRPEAAQAIAVGQSRFGLAFDEGGDSARIFHPSRPEAYPPRVSSNGASGWRHELERPQHWQGARELLSRFGDGFADIPDTVAEDVLQITGMSQDQLRRLHLESAPAPARLADLVDLLRLHQAQPDAGMAALEEQQFLRQRPSSTHERLLKDSFPGLTLRCIQELLERSGTADIERLTSAGRVPLSLAEHARWALRQRRLDRACAGLRWPWASSADSEQLALGLLDQHAPWPDFVRVEVRDTTAQGPLLASHGSLQASELLTVVRAADGYRVQGTDAPSNHVIGALLSRLTTQQRSVLGQSASSEAALLAKVTHDIDRERAASILGMRGAQAGFAPPSRFADGRLGYPLSGRAGGDRQAIRRGIHQIYPTLDDLQLDAYLESLGQQRVGLWEHYAQLQDQLGRLRQALASWQRDWTNPLDALRRRRVATSIRRSWRRKVTDQAEDFVLLIDGESVGSLPSLPSGVSFAHIRRLRLRNMALEDIDNGFLGCFERLIELDLSANRLQAIPQAIEQMPRLRVLRLANNLISLTAAGERTLSMLHELEVLDLSHNPLGRAPALTQLRRLREVRLRDAGLNALPEQVSWCGRVDVRDNQIRQLREDLRQLRDQLERTALHDNPLDEASEALADQASGIASGARGSPSFRHAPVDIALRDAWVGDVSAPLGDRRRAIWAVLQGEADSVDLFRFLADLLESEEVESYPQYYRKRVWQILQACEQHTALRQRLFLEAAGPGTCEDRLTLVLEQMEIAVMAQGVLAAGNATESEASLVALGRGLFRLDEVDRIASRHIARMREEPMAVVDEIEVRLYYRQRLLRPLALPINADEMYYESFANVTTSHLSAAQQEVLTAETPRVLAESIAQRPFWGEQMRVLHPQRFDALADQFHGRMEALEAQVERHAIDEWTYELRSRGLKYEYEIAESRLLRTMAEEALRRLQ